MLNLVNCPLGLRGHVTKWLVEISSGVYVGNISKRVREALWKNIKDTCRNGRATIVYTVNNEQRFDFAVHGDVWTPIDFDGLKLILRPSPSRLIEQKKTTTHGFSNASIHRKIKRHSNAKTNYPKDYIILNILTSGNNSETDEILTIDAIKVIGNVIVDSFHSIKSNQYINNDIRNDILTLHSFIDSMPIVVFNEDANMKFLLNWCVKNDFPLFLNRCIDVLPLARRSIDIDESFDPDDILFSLDQSIIESIHDLNKNEKVKLIYEKLTN